MNEEEQVRHLLEEAGPRPEVPPEDLAKIKAAFRAEWQEHVRQRRSPDRRLWLLAASIVAALALGWWLWPSPAGPVARAESGMRETVSAGAKVETGDSPAAFRLAGGSSLRLDAESRVRLVSASEIRLERGAVYLDSEGTGTVAVHTPLGTVRELGTQFEVRLLGSAVRVRVREGAVSLDGNGTAYKVEAGTELVLHDSGSVTGGRIAAYGPPWSWVLKAAPPLRIEGLTLEEVLERVARETGWTVRFEDPRVAASADEIVVHGDVGHLTPDQALEVVLPGAGLDHRVVDGVLILKAPN
ncbi:MAG TPA: FecR family protein [Thermoanaerobaculia bacterium]|nr:FecR family protein [Thermoanaerobaculia bacterium]